MFRDHLFAGVIRRDREMQVTVEHAQQIAQVLRARVNLLIAILPIHHPHCGLGHQLHQADGARSGLGGRVVA
jgi:hypothetical protein